MPEDSLVFRPYCVLVDSNRDALHRETLATNNCVCCFVVFPSAACVHRNTLSPILISFFFFNLVMFSNISKSLWTMLLYENRRCFYGNISPDCIVKEISMGGGCEL